MAALVPQFLRDQYVYMSGYLHGRSFAIPTSFTDLSATALSKATTLATLPLPFLSFLALPVFGGSSTTISLVFFYLTWSALVLSHSSLWVEVWGTIITRLVCFLLPALGFLAFDCLIPDVSKNIKAQRYRGLPSRLGRRKVIEIAGVAVFNVLFAIGTQAFLEIIWTQVFNVRSILKVTSVVPLPLSVLKHVLLGFAFRGVIHYAVHRYLLHTIESPLKAWHLQWQHSVLLPYSVVAAYDHPVNHLLAQWLPTFLPAYFFRFHVLTWQLFLALVSLEELLVFSGYAILPSTILLTGMARRTDEHFLALDDPAKCLGNYGHWGVLDYILGTTCKDENDVGDDLEAEAQKHRLQNRLQNAADGAFSGLKDRQGPSRSKAKRRGRKGE